jgi:hypothetical protein
VTRPLRMVTVQSMSRHVPIKLCIGETLQEHRAQSTAESGERRTESREERRA